MLRFPLIPCFSKKHENPEGAGTPVTIKNLLRADGSRIDFAVQIQVR
jgi:hypothetical protein